MTIIHLLDCTLRDGGYINNWEFRENHIKKIIKSLTLSNVDIIECGYLNETTEVNIDSTIYRNFDDVLKVLPKKQNSSKYVLMINYGEYSIESIPYNSSNEIFGIRIVFKQKEWKNALLFAEQLIEKKYNIFIQPMMTVNYTDKELLELISEVNRIDPYACYIVDSFGVMKQKDLLRLSYIFDHNLKKEICLGYHAHNNLQLAFSNALAFSDIATNRIKIIDSSIYGMGRGAGNLNTELFVQYLNDNHNKNYCVDPLLKVIDETLNPIYQEKYWGYSMPHYLSAIYYCHPNYASYFSEKNTLTIEDLKNIISQIPIEKKDSFDKEFAERLYKTYQNNYYDDEVSIKNLKESFQNENLLLIGPGRNLINQKQKVKEYIKQTNPLIISLNFKSECFIEDYTFISNSKRFDSLFYKEDLKLIVTSNIEVDTELKVNYLSLLSTNHHVSDNSLLMMLNLLIKIGQEKIALAGFDGFKLDISDNYVNQDLIFVENKKRLMKINEEISQEIIFLNDKIKIEFITDSLYNNLKYEYSS